jgi:hypothetical protein
MITPEGRQRVVHNFTGSYIITLLQDIKDKEEELDHSHSCHAGRGTLDMKVRGGIQTRP